MGLKKTQSVLDPHRKIAFVSGYSTYYYNAWNLEKIQSVLDTHRKKNIVSGYSTTLVANFFSPDWKNLTPCATRQSAAQLGIPLEPLNTIVQ